MSLPAALFPELPLPSFIMRADEIHPGDVIAGKYRVRTILGRSHGLLVEAFHTEIDQRAVIKVLLAGSGDEREIERFRREARVLAKLESEHAARIIDVGTEADGSFYLVRQYLDGIDLGTYVQQQGPLALVDAVLAILQVAEAVAETHGHGIILRELQPSHLFLTQRAGGSPLVRIADFGTAKLMRDAAAPGIGGELTATAMFGLSPYSSPELLRKARDVDARADVWSLGAVLYELLTGRPPFRGEAAFLMLQITREEPAPPSQLRPDLPPEIDRIIDWALAKDVDARFKNVHAFAHALAPFAPPEGQILIERIAQIAGSGRGVRRGSVPPPSFPSSRPVTMGAPAPIPPAASPSGPPAAFPSAPPPARFPDDSVTNVRAAGSRPPPLPGSVPPPPPGHVPAQLTHGEGRSASSAPSATPSASLGRNAALWVIAGSALMVPVLLILLLLKRSSASPPSVPEPAAATAARVTAEALGAPPSTPLPPAPPASTTTAPATAAPPATTTAAAPAASSAAEPGATSAAAKSKSAPVARAVLPAPPPAAAGPSGTLLAVAVGGTCAFTVNGASKGTSSSIRVSLKPGTYAVVCRPASGGSKSKSVTVRGGETAMAAFKL